jgi:hypothetical protein
MKKYVFEITYEVVKEVVVEADDYEEAEVKVGEGEGDVITEEGYDWEFTCIKMPDEDEEVA